MSEKTGEFVTLFHAAMRQENARPRLEVFIKNLKAGEADECVGAYFKASTDAQYHYSRTDKYSLATFFGLCWVAVDRGEPLYAVRFDALVHADASPWRERFDALSPGQQGKLTTRAKQLQKALPPPALALLSMIPKAIQTGRTEQIRKHIDDQDFPQAHKCLLAYLEASLRYRPDNARSLVLFYGISDITIRKGNATFVKDFRRLVATEGTTWSLRWGALDKFLRDDLEKSLKATVLKSEVRELKEPGTGPVPVVTPTPGRLREDVTRRDKPQPTEVTRKFAKLFHAFMTPGGDAKAKKHELTEFIFAQTLPGARECFAAYIEESPRYPADSPESLYIFWGVASLLINKGKGYEALKLDLLKRTPGTVVAQRVTALAAVFPEEKRKLESEITELINPQRRLILDDLKFAYYQKHRADPDHKALWAFEPDVDAAYRDALRGAARDCDRTFRQPDAQRFATTFNAWADLMDAQTDSLVHITMLKWCRELRDISPLLRSEIYWYGVLALQISALMRYPRVYDRGLSQEDKDFFLHPSLVPQAYRTDFDSRLEFVFWKRASKTKQDDPGAKFGKRVAEPKAVDPKAPVRAEPQLREISRVHTLLLFTAQKLGFTLLTMQETKDIHDRLLAFKADKSKKYNDIRIPVSSGFQENVLTLGATVGRLYIVWFEQKKSIAYVEMEGFGRILFAVDSYLKLGRIKRDDLTYGQIWRDTQHLLKVIDGYFQLLGYLPDLVSGGMAGLVTSILTNMAVDAIAENAELGPLETMALGVAANAYTGHMLDRARAERGTRVLLDSADLDELAAGMGRGALWRLEGPTTHIPSVHAPTEGAVLIPPHVSTARDIPTAYHISTSPDIPAAPHVAIAPDVPATPHAPSNPRAVPTPPVVPSGTPVHSDVVSPTARATTPGQKLLPAPKFTAAELQTAKVVGLEPDQVRAMANVFGKNFDTAEMREFYTIWYQIRDQRIDRIRGIQAMFEQGVDRRVIAERAREVFDEMRDAFWQRIKTGTSATEIAARSKLGQAGMSFLGDARAPIVTMKTSEGWANVQVQVDHIAELGQHPMRAFSPRNFRLSSAAENTILLNQMHTRDPFLLQDVRRTVGRGTGRAGKLLDDPNYRGRSPKAGRLADPSDPGSSSVLGADVDAALEGLSQRLSGLSGGEPF